MLTNGKDAAPCSVFVNGQSIETTAVNLADLVAAQDLASKRVATALNGQFIPESRRATTPLNAGDRIEIVSPRQGG